MSRTVWQRSTARPQWGAHFIDDGVVRFRLWAPDQKQVLLLINGRTLPMNPAGNGWVERIVDGVASGSSYLFQLDDGTQVADPASRAQLSDIAGPSLVVDGNAYAWKHPAGTGATWEEVVLYEIHIGTFTDEGTFTAAIPHLAHLRDIGITAIEIMPVAQFTGMRGWGYDGVLHYAPHNVYGSPDDLKALIDAAHGHGIMVFLDVVYNHFGPEGNYLHLYASGFFNEDRHTPWGASIAFECEPVRRYFIENALYWIGEFRFDGLRFDATDQIIDSSADHFLDAMVAELRNCFPERDLHLVMEDHDGRRPLLARDSHGRPHLYTASWNDDLHHVIHVIATGETKGYYAASADEPWPTLAKALTDGFVFAHGERIAAVGSSAQPLPPQAFVNFLQNHDQVGNRAFGERLPALIDDELMRVLTAMLLLVPQIPLLFMGQEYGEPRGFHFFADCEGALAEGIRGGRQQEAENFGGMPKGVTAADLPDPISEQTFLSSRLCWQNAATDEAQAHISFVRDLIRLRQTWIVPLLLGRGAVSATALPTVDGVIAINWQFANGTLALRANLATDAKPCPLAQGEIIFSSDGCSHQVLASELLAGPGLVVAISL